MTTISPALDLACRSALGARTELIREVQNGLHSRPRSLKPWMLYDELGSRLFEQITTLPEYYPTRTERLLLERRADAIVASACADSQPLRVVELGAGTATKTCLLLAAAARRQIDVIYMPLDVSADALGIACRAIESAFQKYYLSPLSLITSTVRQDWRSSTAQLSRSISVPASATLCRRSRERFFETSVRNYETEMRLFLEQIS